MAIELNWQTGAPVSPPGGFRGDHRPLSEQSTPVTLDNPMEILTAAGAPS
jgi:hypothetical protein